MTGFSRTISTYPEQTLTVGTAYLTHIIPCSVAIYWWDCDLTTRCIRSHFHVTDPTSPLHTDGLWWWDENGIRQPTDLRVSKTANKYSHYKPGKHAFAGGGRRVR